MTKRTYLTADEVVLADKLIKKALRSQAKADRRYRAAQKELGIVRKTIRVPENRWEELQAIAKQMREDKA